MSTLYRTFFLGSMAFFVGFVACVPSVMATSTERGNMNRARIETRVSSDVSDEDTQRPDARKEGDSVQVRQQDRVNDPTEPRGEFLDARARWMSADDAERIGLRADMIVRARGLLTHSVEVLIAKLTRLKGWVADHPRVSDDFRRDVAKKVDAEISSLRDALSGLERDDVTLEEIQTMAQRVRSRMRSYHETVLEIVAQIKEHRTEHEQERLLSLVEKIKSLIARYTTQGVDLSVHTQTLLEIQADVAEAETPEDIRTAFQALKELLARIRITVNGSGTVLDDTPSSTDS